MYVSVATAGMHAGERMGGSWHMDIALLNYVECCC